MEPIDIETLRSLTQEYHPEVRHAARYFLEQAEAEANGQDALVAYRTSEFRA